MWVPLRRVSSQRAGFLHACGVHGPPPLASLRTTPLHPSCARNSTAFISHYYTKFDTALPAVGGGSALWKTSGRSPMLRRPSTQVSLPLTHDVRGRRMFSPISTDMLVSLSMNHNNSGSTHQQLVDNLKGERLCLPRTCQSAFESIDLHTYI